MVTFVVDLDTSLITVHNLIIFDGDMACNQSLFGCDIGNSHPTFALSDLDGFDCWWNLSAEGAESSYTTIGAYYKL